MIHGNIPSLMDDFWIQMAILLLVSLGVFAIIDMLIDPFKLKEESNLSDGQWDNMT